MSRTQTKIAAFGTVAALGVLGAAAMASGGADSTASVGTQPTAVVPEVRTVVVKKVVHRTKHVKAKAPTSPARAASTPVSPAPRVALSTEAVAPYSGEDATRDDTKLTSRTSGAAGEDGEEHEEGGEENGDD